MGKFGGWPNMSWINLKTEHLTSRTPSKTELEHLRTITSPERETDDETGELILCSTSQNISFLNTQILRAAAGSTHHLLKTTGCPTSNCTFFACLRFFATPSVICQTYKYCFLKNNSVLSKSEFWTRLKSIPKNLLSIQKVGIIKI